MRGMGVAGLPRRTCMTSQTTGASIPAISSTSFSAKKSATLRPDSRRSRCCLRLTGRCNVDCNQLPTASSPCLSGFSSRGVGVVPSRTARASASRTGERNVPMTISRTPAPITIPASIREPMSPISFLPSGNVHPVSAGCVAAASGAPPRTAPPAAGPGVVRWVSYRGRSIRGTTATPRRESRV